MIGVLVDCFKKCIKKIEIEKRFKLKTTTKLQIIINISYGIVGGFFFRCV